MKKSLLMVLACMLTGCSHYQNTETSYQLEKSQKSVALTLTDSYETILYNVTQPIDIHFIAPKNNMIMIGDKLYTNYKVHIKPQESINLAFKLKDLTKDKDSVYPIETHVATYKRQAQQANILPLKEQSGKYTNLVGEKVYFSLQNNPKKIVLETHEYNQYSKYQFHYIGGTKPTIIKIIAPNDTVFVFDNGTKAKEYNIVVNPHQDSYLYMNLYHEKSGSKYNRYYKIIRSDND